MQNKNFSSLLEKNSEYYELVDSIPNGYALNEIILDYKHEPVDYLLREVNSAYEELTGLRRQDIIGKNILDILPQTPMEWIQLCGDVALNQKDICTEYYSPHLQRHYHVRIQSRKKGFFLTVFNDITSLKIAHNEVEKQKESYETLFNSVRVGLLRTSIDDGRIIKANPVCAEIFGFDDLKSFMSTPVVDLYKDPNDRDRHRERLLSSGKLNYAVLSMHKADKKPLSIAVHSSLHYENGHPVWIDSTVQDISKQQRAEKQLEINSIVFEHTLEAVVISDENHKIVTVNKAFTDITGYTRKEMIGKEFNLLWSQDKDQEDQCKAILNELNNSGSWQGEIYKRHKEGHAFPAHLSVIRGEKSRDLKHYVSIFYDITYRKQSEEKLYRLAHFDALTGLSNRHAFMDRLRESIEKAKLFGNRCAVFYMDLDGFKTINDTHGHDAGDEVLITTASRLKKLIRKSDMVARIGGDEFTLIIEDFTDTKSLNILAQKMIEAVSKEIKLQESALQITTSIGISIYPDDALELESVLRHADNAMYRAKELGKNNLQFFTKELNIDSVNQMIFEMELRHAIEKDEIQIFYQPRVSLTDKKIIGFEALLSWENETYGKVSPEVFLPVAMQSDLINDICSWLISTALSQLEKWQNRYHKEFSLSFGLPDKLLSSTRCLPEIEKALRLHQVRPELLHLQVRQNALMREKSVQQLISLHKLGVKLIIEEFGSGISSLADLHKVPISAVKIDERFTHSQEEQDQLILHSLIQLAQILKADLISSGIQEHSDLEFLKTAGCDQGQGTALYPAKNSQETGLLLAGTV